MPRESTIKIQRSDTAAVTPSGLTAGELAVNLADRKLFVGGTAGSNITFLDSSAVVTSFNGLTGAVAGVASVNGSTGAVVTYVGTTGNIPYRYGAGVGITANSYFTLQSSDIGAPTDILILSGATNDSALHGNTEARGLEFHRAYAGLGYGLGLDEGGGVGIVARGNYNDGAGDYGSSLWLVTPSVGGIIRLAPQGSEVVQVGAGYISVVGSLSTTSTVSFGDTVTMIGGAVLEYDGSFPIPTVLSVYNTFTEANTLTLNAVGSFSHLTTSGTITGVTGAFSGNISAPNIVTSVNGATGAVTVTSSSMDFVLFNLGII